MICSALPQKFGFTTKVLEYKMGEKIKPIRPDEIESNMEYIIPDFVFESVNELLKEVYRGTGYVTIKTDAIVKKILANPRCNVSKDTLFKKRYLDFEKVYGKYGWKVTFDKPAYDENYDSFYKFEAKK